jgi:phosphoglycerate dehydrogenase-like enzyme
VAGPAIALAMMAGLVDHAFTPAQLERLDAAGELADPVPLDSFDGDRAAAVLGRAEVLVGHWGCPTLTGEVLAAAPRLRLFAYAAGTVKWQVTDAVWARDLVVTSAAAANAVPVAEYTVAMVLLAGKGVLLFREWLRDPQLRLPIDASTVGNYRRRIGLVGASLVGRRVIDLLAPYDLEVAVYDPFLGVAEAAQLGVEKVDDLDALCESVDVLSLHAPDVEATRGMIGAAQLAALPDGATVVNTARPALVDQAALEAELVSGRLAAILDVADPDPLPRDHPLLARPNVFVTPHVAGAMGNELHRLAELAVLEVERFARGEAPLHPVRAEDLDRIA